MSRDCEAQRVNDEMLCGRCGLTWALDDPDRPACRRVIDRRVIPDRPLSRMVRQLEGERPVMAPAAPPPPFRGANLNARMRFALRVLLVDVSRPPEPALEQELRDILEELEK